MEENHNQDDVGTRKGTHRDIQMFESPSSLLQKPNIYICIHTQKMHEQTHTSDLHNRRTTNTNTNDQHQDTNQGHNCGGESIKKPCTTFDEHHQDHTQGQCQDTHQHHNCGHHYAS